MNKNTLVFVIVLFLAFIPALAGAGENTTLDRVEVLVGSDDNGKVSQDIRIPLYWSENLSSSFSYTGRSYSEKKPLDSDIKGKKGDLIEEDRFELGLLTYRKGVSRMGFGVEYIALDKKEIGHAWLSLNGNPEELNAFENDVDIELIRPVLSADITWGILDRMVVFRTTCRLIPLANLQVDHETEIIPSISETLKGHSDKIQKPSVAFKGEMQWALTDHLNFGASVSYDYLPIHYTMSLAEDSNDTVDIKTEDSTFSWDARLVVNTTALNDLMPTVGFGVDRVKTKDKNNSENNTTRTVRKLIIGFEKRF